MRNVFSLPSLVALSLVAAAGCAQDDATDADAPAEATSAIDSTETASAESAVIASTTYAVTAAVPAMAATQAAASAGTYLLPAGCATATAAGATVTYTVRDCTGPYGLALLNGTFTATYSPAAGGVGVAVRGNVTLPRGNVTLDLTATVTSAGSTRTAAVTSASSGTGPNGRAVTHAGAFTATYDGTCATLSGAFSTTAVGVTWNTTVANYRRCQSMCPSGTVTFASTTGRSATATYSGGATAAVTVGGRSYTVGVYCGG